MRPILIVEDHPLVAEATASLLVQFHEDLQVVLCADAERARFELEDSTRHWFRIFLDLDVPGAMGLSLAREVQRRGLTAVCCVVSAFEDRGYVEEIQASGFLGYIIKAIRVADFTAALESVLDGRPWFPPISSNKRPQAIRLTQRQTQLLELVRIGMSSKEMAAELHIAEGTVNNHIAAVLQLLDAGTRAQVVAKAIELGLLELWPRGLSSDVRRRLTSGRR